MTNEERIQAIEWLKRRPVMMAGAKRMYDLAVEALEAYVPDMNVGKWNPVSERLPETSEDILILLDDYKNMSVGRYYAADGEWYADFGEGPFDGVVAWMPLPEPMKKVSLEPWEGEEDE